MRNADQVSDYCERVRAAANTFRVALERCPPSALGVGFEAFPAGACGDTSLLLGRFLRECGLGDWNYVSAVRREQSAAGWPTMMSHAWLECDGVIVDITSDQFEQFDDIVVVPAAEVSEFYATFEPETRSVADYRSGDPSVVSYLDSVYRQVLSRVSAASRSLTQSSEERTE